jgi:Mrp family chromosome partitioning ATPase
VEGSADVEALTDYELLGRVPRRRKFPEDPLTAFTDPVIGTAVRSLRVRVAGDLPAGGSVTVTSPIRAEGKTTIAALLATSFARTGVEVCLIDGDLRRPRLTTWLADWDGPGLDRVLSREASVGQAVTPGWTDHLSVLPTAPNAAAGESMAERMPDIIRELNETFELVLIDAPHVLGSDEARVLASGSDRVVLVVAAGTSQAALHESSATLAGLRARVAGYVLNRAASGGIYSVGDLDD